MKRILFAAICFISVSIIKAQSPMFQWAKGIQGTSEVMGTDVVTDPSGNVYTIGWFFGTADFDPGIGTFNLTSAGQRDIFICKLDVFGNFVWAKQFGGNPNEICLSVNLDSFNNIYITGNFQGTLDFDPGPGITNLISNSTSIDIFICKLDMSGNFVWAKNLGGQSSDTGYSIVLDILGNIYLEGSFDGTVDFDPGNGVFNLTSIWSNDLFILKLDASGNFIWAKTLGGGIVDNEGCYMAIDLSGNVYLASSFLGTIDFDPGPGTYFLSANVSCDAFISKLDSQGNFVWAKKMGGTSCIFPTSLTIDYLGNVYSTGFFYGQVDLDPGPGIYNLTSNGQNDIFILKLNPIGDFIWTKQIGGVYQDRGLSINTDLIGNVYSTGYFGASADFDPGTGIVNLSSVHASTDIYISKLDSIGNFVWALNMGGFHIALGQYIKINKSNNDIYTIGGFSKDTIDFDPGIGVFNLQSSSLPYWNLFIHKMSQPGVGIKENYNYNNISVFPNPTNGIINIQASANSATDKLKIEISNIIGQVLNIETTVTEHTSLNIQNFPSGLYFLKVISDGNLVETKKIIKE
jgi:hypothetical protein